MIIITINGKKYKGVNQWHELTLSKFIELTTIDLPTSYIDSLKGDKETDMPFSDIKQMCEETVRKCSNIPLSVINQLEPNSLISLFKYFSHFTATIALSVPLTRLEGKLSEYIPDRITKIKRYRLPKDKNIFNEDIPMANITIGQFSEAADIDNSMGGFKNNIQMLSVIVSIYCENKKYKESRVLRRAKKFQNLKMNVVFGVFYHHRRSFAKIVEHFDVLFKGKGGSNKLANYGFRGLIYEVANKSAYGTVEQVKQIPAYDFFDYVAYERTRDEIYSKSAKGTD